jgi:hypothetical protein
VSASRSGRKRRLEQVAPADEDDAKTGPVEEVGQLIFNQLVTEHLDAAVSTEAIIEHQVSDSVSRRRAS